MLETTKLKNADPLLILEALADVNEWGYHRDSDSDVSSIKVPGDYSEYMMCVRWLVNSEMLIVRVTIPIFPVPDHLIYELYKLLNLMNKNAIFGSWFVDTSDDESHHIVWRQEIHADIESITEECIARLVSHCCLACDGFYPAMQMFLTTKPRFRGSSSDSYLVKFGLDAEEAMEYIDEVHPVGTA